MKQKVKQALKKSTQSVFKAVADTFKEKPGKIGSLLVAAMGLFQLAISNVHIVALITLKETNNNPSSSGYTPGFGSSGIGFFFFFFILFGLVAVFAATRINNDRTTLFAISTNILACVFGFIYLLKLTNPDSYTSYAKISSSVIWMYVAFAGYLLAALFYVKQYFHYRKDKKNNKTNEIFED